MNSRFNWNSVPECSTLKTNKNKGFWIIGTEFFFCSTFVPLVAVMVEQIGTTQFVPFHSLRIVNIHAGYRVEQGWNRLEQCSSIGGVYE